MEIMRAAMSTCGFKEMTDNDFDLLVKAGIRDIEISVSDFMYKTLDHVGIAKRAEYHGVNIWSYHLPFSPFEEIDIARKELKNYSVTYFSELIKKAGDIGVKYVVVHPSGEPFSDAERGEAIEISMESLAQLAEVASREGCVIAVEDLPRTCLGRNSDEILKLISADERLRVCFDTNHLLGETIKDFIEAVGDKIVTTHFSDYDFKNERHWVPGEGDINWVELIEALEKVGYTGPILYEVGLTPSYSIERRNLTFEDFEKNRRLLVEKKPLDVIGTPILEKCIHWKEL